MTSWNAGQYVCTASNDVGEPVNRKITLEVEFAPYISVPRPRVPQAEHFDAELSCHVVAYPAAGITWRRDNKTITNNGNYHIDHFASQGERTTSTLKVCVCVCGARARDDLFIFRIF